jgi:hypothetical protein
MINSDRVSTFTIATGPRGAAKTLYMSSKVCNRLLKKYLMEKLHGATNIHVWSNYPAGFWYNSPIENKPVWLETEPLNMEAMMLWDDDFCNGWAFIDEMDQWYDRQEWSAVSQKLMNKGMTQIRKKKLSMVGTVQDLGWINKRGQFQTDIIISCRELAFTPFGRKVGLNLGELSSLSIMDKSGVLTGYTYEESGRVIKKRFKGKRFWNTYDTNFQFNPLDTMTKYKIKVPTKIIDVGDSYQSQKTDRDMALFSDLIQEFREEGRLEVTKSDVWKKAREMGWQGEYWEGGTTLMKLGAEKIGSKGQKYSFENVPQYAPEDGRGMGVSS